MSGIKRIGIVYMSNGSMVNISKSSALLYLLRKELEEEGKVLKSLTHNRATFEDGSIIQMDRFSAFRGMRATHYYVDSDILNMAGGLEMIDANLRPLLINDGVNKYDLSGEQLLSFNIDNNNLITKTI